MAIRIYAVLGDYYHKAEWSEQALQSAVSLMNERSDEVCELRPIPYTGLGEAIDERPDVLVISKEERLQPEAEDPGRWMDAELQAKIVSYVESGGAIVAWHSGLAYHSDGAYRRMLRGWFLHHPEQKQVTYRPVGEHELSRIRVEKFAFKDEHYFVHCEEAETEVFLHAESADGGSVAGWTHDYGQGRICCLTPAHTLEGLTDQTLIELLAQCLAYSQRR